MLKRKKWQPIAGVLSLLMLAAAGWFLYRLIDLNVLPDRYMLMGFGAVLAVLIIALALLFGGIHRTRGSVLRRVQRIIGVILALALSFGSAVGAVVLGDVAATKNAVAETSVKNRAMVGVYVLSGDAANTLTDAADYSFGLLDVEEEELNNKYILDQLKAAVGKEVASRSYGSITELATALSDGDVRAVAFNKAYFNILDDLEGYSNFEHGIKLLQDIPVPVDVEQIYATPTPTPAPEATPTPTPDPTPVPVSNITEPFILYLSGSDSRDSILDTTSNRADVNILMAVSPKTHQVLLLTTPRDYYVPKPSSKFAGAMDKLEACGLYGPEGSELSLEALYDISIDNYVLVNFSGFTYMIDAIGGITIDNPTAFTSSRDAAEGGDPEYFPEGEQHIDGYKALIYARERQNLADGDLARGRNQMRVIKAVINQVMTESGTVLMNYSDILNGMSEMFATDLTSDQISNIVKLAMTDMSSWDIKSYGVSGNGGMSTTSSSPNQALWIMRQDPDIVDHAKELLQKVMNGETITDEDVNFRFDINH